MSEAQVQEIRNDLLQALADELIANTRQPGDVTATELARATGRSKETCRTFLANKASAGELIAVSIIEDGHRVTVYRKP